MLTEVRTLTFPEEDLIRGILLQFRDHFKGVARTSTASLELRDGPEIAASFQVQNQEDGETFDLKLDENDLLQAMLKYCLENKVPVSRDAKKSVERVDGLLSLRFFIDGDAHQPANTDYFVHL